MHISFPTYGIAERRFVITVAPQNDICPQGNTYPINAVAVVKNRITTPTDHVSYVKRRVLENEENLS